jgi:hypothetical protein
MSQEPELQGQSRRTHRQPDHISSIYNRVRRHTYLQRRVQTEYKAAITRLFPTVREIPGNPSSTAYIKISSQRFQERQKFTIDRPRLFLLNPVPAVWKDDRSAQIG